MKGDNSCKVFSPRSRTVCMLVCVIFWGRGFLLWCKLLRYQDVELLEFVRYRPWIRCRAFHCVQTICPQNAAPYQEVIGPANLGWRGQGCPARPNSIVWKNYRSRLPSSRCQFVDCSVRPVPTFRSQKFCAQSSTKSLKVIRQISCLLQKLTI